MSTRRSFSSADEGLTRVWLDPGDGESEDNDDVNPWLAHEAEYTIDSSENLPLDTAHLSDPATCIDNTPLRDAAPLMQQQRCAVAKGTLDEDTVNLLYK